MSYILTYQHTHIFQGTGALGLSQEVALTVILDLISKVAFGFLVIIFGPDVSSGAKAERSEEEEYAAPPPAEAGQNSRFASVV